MLLSFLAILRVIVVSQESVKRVSWFRLSSLRFSPTILDYSRQVLLKYLLRTCFFQSHNLLRSVCFYECVFLTAFSEIISHCLLSKEWLRESDWFTVTQWVLCLRHKGPSVSSLMSLMTTANS